MSNNITIDHNVPVGSIITFGGEIPKDIENNGWFLCDGRMLNADNYPELFKAIGYNFGKPSDKYFNIPQLNGLFLRGNTNDKNRDPDLDLRKPLKHGGSKSGIGSFQTYGTAKPKNPFTTTIENGDIGSLIVGCGCGSQGTLYNSGSNVYDVFSGGDLETRPKNKYVYFIIKYKSKEKHTEPIMPPIGSIIPFAGIKPDHNLEQYWLFCNGEAHSSGAGIFNELFKAIQYAHGKPDEKTYNLPDYRGYFLRGVDVGNGEDPNAKERTESKPGGHKGDKVGSCQTSATAMPVKEKFSTTINHIPSQQSGKCINGLIYEVFFHNNDSTEVDVTQGGGDNESRPINIYVDWYMRFRNKGEYPIGAVVAHGGELPENHNWLPCDGKKYNTEKYSTLYEILGNTYGGQKDKKTFAVPDYRGYFLRGQDHGTKNDPDAKDRKSSDRSDSNSLTGDKMGTIQNDATQKPVSKHFSTKIKCLPNSLWKSHYTAGRDISLKLGDLNLNTCTTGGDGDTRPKNININYYIRCQ